MKTLKYPERIILSDPTQMMCLVDHVVNSMGTSMIDNGCSLANEFNELISRNL